MINALLVVGIDIILTVLLGIVILRMPKKKWKKIKKLIKPLGGKKITNAWKRETIGRD
jgi:uncharacterized membrane-anchored protein YhcB (DUF1043 family)